MGHALARLASELDCSERTLRRCLNDGMFQALRLGPRSVELLVAEQDYARGHWPLLSQLRTGLRTERSVRLAVLFGSMATGENRAESDVDLFVVLRDRDAVAPLHLARRLRERVGGRPVQIVTVDQARMQPSLFADVLIEGRVLIDRDSIWKELKRHEANVIREALLSESAIARAAQATVANARRRLL